MAELVPADEGPLLDQILRSTYEIWSDGLRFETYQRFYYAQRSTAWGRTHLHRFALVDGDRLLASAKLYTFEAVLDGEPIRVAGVGAVFTEPAHRSHGAAPQLIELLLARAQADGSQLALLFSEIGAGYYERLGFTPIATTNRVLRVTESTRNGAPMTMVRGGEWRDLQAIAAMGAVRAASARFHLTRDEDAIRHAITKKRLLAGLGPAGARELQFFIAEEGMTAAAYVVIGVKGNAWTIEECGDRDPTGARVGALLQALVAREPAMPRPAITAWLPSGFLPPQVTVIGEEASADVMMLRPLSASADAAIRLRDADLSYWTIDRF